MSSGQANVLLCVTKLREEEKRIAELLTAQGLQVEVNLDSMALPLGEAHGSPGRKPPDIALIRCLSQKNALSRATLLDLAGIRTLNSVRAITVCTNKIHQAVVFEGRGIPQPRFQVAFTAASLGEAFEAFGQVFVVKPASSSWGRGIARIVGREGLDGWIAARESLDPSHQSFPVLVQEYVDKGDFDIRVVVVGREPIAAFRRVSPDNWKTNTHLGAEVEPLVVDAEIRALCGRLTDVLGEGIYGVDLFYDYKEHRYLVCEVNQNPEFAKSWKIHGVDVASHIAAYVSSKITSVRSFQPT
ncbi:ATP-grasp domain-containing protein [Paenibacillus mucilaginosus]|uniref:Ribosomal protein S6 modification protein n=2 Tax=Paenibacillus mucilaginosus TaxID=61624 RepID=H6NP37_9BACL|nr:RimK family alpha-L-glutamate ligase [Paenibacillus mucilaginosus]AEI43464.1 ribosomal protein S6 modification protein [Paenibacillus mucilaginosus KNP414]AFC31111.1 ribosomal protein S6 modification protein [Paenibacillus mucilaginosus 3016]MCG7211990.1 RimK family alpha-L-glutamate ligase [Paenibacillus mucilaginosus]WDM25021.1 RimK family alpha-L-glutamate ligase [Paenibacillus mucilaginosus]WFA19693.1 RimK family alpha-L-glutamate ligase [Paenibacillus mucilaginosus]